MSPYYFRLCAAFLLIAVGVSQAGAQITGVITDQDGEPLPYANIYIAGTNIGTASNIDGTYLLDLEPGSYEVIYQYVGYESARRSIDLSAESVTERVALRPESVELSGVTISADAEDPAYPIMRKAIAKRDYHLNLVKAFHADIYIKGLIKMTDAPTKIMGQEVGNLNGLLDTARQGVLYLSETRSTVNFIAPDGFSEEIYAKRTSGSNDGVDFNNLRFSWFNFYKERLEFEREVISPLADDAFTYYRFRLEGVTYNADGQEVNKIAVLPKDSYRPTVFGHLYIGEDSWDIHSLSLSITGKSQKLSMIDTVTFKQNHVPVPAREVQGRYMRNQSITFSSGLLGFKVVGGFTYVFNDFEITTTEQARSRKAEVLRVLEEAEKDSVYWQANRPIPLTSEERSGYRKRDSLKVLRTSKPYLDSIDRENNKLSWSKPLLGYTYSNSYKKYSISNSGLIQKISFNAVEGIKVGNATTYRFFNDETGTSFTAKGNVYYGFSDQRWKAYGSLSHRYNRKESAWWRLSGGRRYMQVDHQNPVPPISNTLRSLFNKEHLSNVYQNTGLALATGRELVNGLFYRLRVGYSHRSPLDNNSDWSLYNRDEEYEPNDIGIARDRKSYYHAALIWYPGIQYMTYPTSKTWLTSDWPRVELEWTHALPVWDAEDQADYSQLELSIRDSDLPIGLWGSLRYNVSAGTFLRNTTMNRVDRRHFLTNDLTVNWDERYSRQYKNMPYYTYDTDQSYVSVITEYDFKGLLMDKVPLLRDVGAHTIIALGHLTTTDQTYNEVSVGLDGFKLLGLNILRLDYVWSWDGADFLDHAFVLTLRNTTF